MFALASKWVSVVILAATSILFLIDFVPPYAHISRYDHVMWGLILFGLAVSQGVMLVYNTGRCCKRRVWSDFLLQVSGITLIGLTSVFGVMYPPFSWAMGVFPLVGLLFIIVGKGFSERSREIVRGENV